VLLAVHRADHAHGGKDTQQGPPQAGWGQQYTLDLKPAGARTYEPEALLPSYTAAHIRLLGRFYRLTGETKFLAGIPAALDWLERCRLPESMTEGGKYTHPVFVEIGTDEPLFVHRKGSNVIHGFYYVNHRDDLPNAHYGNKSRIDVGRLRQEYEALKALSVEEAVKDSPLIPGRFSVEGKLPQDFYPLKKEQFRSRRGGERRAPGEEAVREVLANMDSENRWMTKHVSISNPYSGDGTKTEPTDDYAFTHVGDETDTSPYRDESDQEYISTGAYIRSMSTLIDYVIAARGGRDLTLRSQGTQR
jgi:hypothetical protein